MHCRHCGHPHDAHNADQKCRMRIGVGWNDTTAQFVGGYRDCTCPGYSGPLPANAPPCPHDFQSAAEHPLKCIYCNEIVQPNARKP